MSVLSLVLIGVDRFIATVSFESDADYMENKSSSGVCNMVDIDGVLHPHVLLF